MLTKNLNSLLLAAAPLLLGVQLGAIRAARAEGGTVIPEEARPRGMVLLMERVVAGGKQAIGVYGITPDAQQPGVFRVKVWDETPNNVVVRNETIRCSKEEPLRVTSDGTYLFVRSLNPGGPITPANRIDHLVWWATCVPEHGGKDPATLKSVARQLGYTGNLVESEQVLPGGGGGRR